MTTAIWMEHRVSTAEILDELGIYLLGGRVKDPARAIDEAQKAESLDNGREKMPGDGHEAARWRT